MKLLLERFTRWRRRCNDHTEIVAILVAKRYLHQRGRDDLAKSLGDYAEGLVERYNELYCRKPKRSPGEIQFL